MVLDVGGDAVWLDEEMKIFMHLVKIGRPQSVPSSTASFSYDVAGTIKPRSLTGRDWLHSNPVQVCQAGRGSPKSPRQERP